MDDDYTEEVETVLPEGYNIGGRVEEETRSKTKKNGSKHGGFFKKFSKRKVAKATAVTKSTTPLEKKSSPSSSPSNAPQQKLQITSASKLAKADSNPSKIVKQERRDTEEAPTTSQPTREGSPTPTTECSLTDESAESQSKPSIYLDDDEETITDTTTLYGKITGVQSPKKEAVKEEEEEEDTSSIYGMIAGVLSPRKNNVEETKVEETKVEETKAEEKKVEEEPTSLESLLTATSTFVRGQSGVSGSSMRNMSSKNSELSEPIKQNTDDKVTSTRLDDDENASVEVVQTQGGGSVVAVAKPEKVPSSGHSWASAVATITGKVNEVMDGIDSVLVKQAEQEFERTEVAVDYKENPTKLFRLLQQKSWELAMKRLEKRPEEAEVWVYRKVVPENAPASDPDQSQQETKPAKYRWKLLPLHASIVLGAPLEVTIKILNTYPDAARKMDERGSLPVHLAASRLPFQPR